VVKKWSPVLVDSAGRGDANPCQREERSLAMPKLQRTAQLIATSGIARGRPDALLAPREAVDATQSAHRQHARPHSDADGRTPLRVEVMRDGQINRGDIHF